MEKAQPIFLGHIYFKNPELCTSAASIKLDPNSINPEQFIWNYNRLSNLLNSVRKYGSTSYDEEEEKKTVIKNRTRYRDIE